MRLSLILLITLVLGLALYAAPTCASTSDEVCGARHERWVNLSTSLKDALDHYMQIKEESVGPEIIESLSGGNQSLSMARIVQSILGERRERLAAAEAKCRELGDNEKFAFDDLKRCVSAPAQKRNNTISAAVAAISRDRERLLKEMRELLLDEAYVQYRGEREPSGMGYSDYRSDQVPRMSGQQQWSPDSRSDRRWSENYGSPQTPYGGYYYR